MKKTVKKNIKKATKARAKPVLKNKIFLKMKNKKAPAGKSKAALRLRPKAVLDKKTKKKIRAIRKKTQHLFTYGEIDSRYARILMLAAAIIFVLTFMIVQLFIVKNKKEETQFAEVVIKKNTEIEKEISRLVDGYPIEKMTPYIVEQDPKVAAFLVAIAKKESNWGKRRPVLDGKDCFNYWGFRMKAENMGSGGHTCFDSPKEAVEVVASRIDELVKEEKIDTPVEMVIWKCGYACDGPAANGAQKWVKDVGLYYGKFANYL